MRKKRNPQMSIFDVLGKHPGAKELEQVGKILDANPGMLQHAHKCLIKNRRTDTGRGAMTAEQVLLCAVLKQFRELTYEDLEYYLADSHSFRKFAKIGHGMYPSKSALHGNIKALDEDTCRLCSRC